MRFAHNLKFLLVLVLLSYACVQQKTFNAYHKKGEYILNGKIDLAFLHKTEKLKWFNEGYKRYKPNDIVLIKLKP